MSLLLINTILSNYRAPLGDMFTGYSNHCSRVYTYAVQLSNANEEEQKQLAIAAAFHDIGIWTADTFDYLGPSVKLAEEYLIVNGLQAYTVSVTEIILNHHKLSSYKANPLAEAFRKADLIDLSFGLFRFGINSRQLAETKAAYPFNGFHRFIFKKIALNFVQHPFNPLPIVKC